MKRNYPLRVSHEGTELVRNLKSSVIVCLLAAALPAGAQIVSFGVRGGVPLTDAYSTIANPALPLSTGRFVVGPTVELHLPFGLGAQADALYRTYKVGGTVTQWEFPILATYHFHKVGPIFRPFVDGGPSFNHISGPFHIATKTAAGFALGAGIEAKALFVRVEPEIRWTHWGQTNFTYNTVSSNRNELEFLVGVTF